MSFALAISASRPVLSFETPADLARAILDRPNGYQKHTLHIGACWGREGRGEAAIAIYGQGERVGFVGYAIGFGHDREALGAVLESVRAEQPQ